MWCCRVFLVGYVSVFRVQYCCWRVAFSSFIDIYFIYGILPKPSLCKLNAVYTALLRHGVGNACTSPSSLADNNIFILVVAKR